MSGLVVVWCSLLALALAAGGTGTASAQVSLELHHRVDAPGENAFKGRLLPPNTTTIVVPYSAEKPHTLENAGMSRQDLARRVLERLRVRDDTVQVTGERRTDQKFSSTSQSGEVLYVLAHTPADSLYESYVNTGEGFVPGFDAVASGRMTMGPVPPAPARRYRATFRVYRDEAGASPSTADRESGSQVRPASDETQNTAATSQRSQSAERQPQTATTSTDGSLPGGIWTFLVVALLGGAVGAGLVWYLSAGRIEELEGERNRLKRRLNRHKNADFQKATGASPANSDEGSGESTTAAVDRLHEENEELREKNQSLRDEIREIRRYVENLREERS